jgi:cell division protein FtsB
MFTSLRSKLIASAVVALALFAAGFLTHAYRHNARVAGYEKREQQRLDQISKNDAEQNRLRGENDQLRAHVAKLSADDEALRAIIDSRGGVIAAEAKNLEQISEQLKHDQAVIASPSDRCVRCRAFSARAVASGQIGKPLACKDECPGATQ